MYCRVEHLHSKLIYQLKIFHLKIIFFQHFAIFVGLWPPFLDEEDKQSIGQFFITYYKIFARVPIWNIIILST